MNDKEVLQRAIDIAFSNGWNTTHFDTLKYSYKHPEDSELLDVMGKWHDISPMDVIYNHEFAKSLFGEADEIVWADDQRMESLPSYKMHLQQMVISEDPIDYLRKLLPLLNR